LAFNKDAAFLIIFVAIFGGIITPILSFDFAFATPEGGGDTGDDGGGDSGGGDETDLEPEPEPDSDQDPGFVGDPDPCEENPEAEGCTSEPPIDPCIKDPSLQGCGSPSLITPPTRVPDPPDDDCIYDPSLPKCAPTYGKCPEGFNMNKDGQCYPDKPCPPGFARVDNDESGACLPTPPGGDDCNPSYPDSCIKSPPPKLNCPDISFRNFKVIGSDPHGFDGDKDGVGCENGEGGSSSGGSNNNNDDGASTSTNECQGQADCFRGTVTEIVDGDTIDINNVRVRLALVITPERGDNGYTEAIDFVESVCGVGTTSLVDEDDGQKEGSFDRLIGFVYCGNDNINNKKSLNELLLERGYAVIYQDFCGISEFSSASWAQKYGC
jgi:endonuclease YncB( thermonuclease family)